MYYSINIYIYINKITYKLYKMFCNANYIIYTENKIPEYRTDISTLWTGTSKALIIMKNLQNVNIQPSFNKFILTSSHSMPRSVCCFSCFFFFSARVFWLPPEMAWITISVGSSVGRVARIPGSDCRWQRSGRKNGVEKGYYMNFGLLLLRETPCHMCMYIYICDYYIYITYIYHIIYHISVMWFIRGVQMVSRCFPNHQTGISSHFEELGHAMSCHAFSWHVPFLRWSRRVNFQHGNNWMVRLTTA